MKQEESQTDGLAAEREKRWVALTSLWAAVGITTFKLIVGMLTGSLGILAEAAHSGLDLVAAFVTFLAIRAAAKPPDREHPYGHGKVENLSALFETFLLLLTCVWIFYEAGHRLLAQQSKVQVNVWSFLVMFTSIIVDYSRSRALSRVAKKHNSQALEADALHFQTDIWSSFAVVGGLICVKIGDWTSWQSLHYADAVAAVAVALIVVYVCFELGLRTIHGLLDTAPAGMEQQIIGLVEAISGVSNCHHVRIRCSGPQVFVDIHVLVDGSQTLSAAHVLTDRVEASIQQAFPNADITVHPEPTNEPTSVVIE